MRDRWCSCMRSADDHCLTLFDKWCERRAVLPLCYLLNAWPMTSASGSAINRLYALLDELLANECAGLRESERKTINMILRNRCIHIDGSADEVANVLCEMCSRGRGELPIVQRCAC